MADLGGMGILLQDLRKLLEGRNKKQDQDRFLIRPASKPKASEPGEFKPAEGVDPHRALKQKLSEIGKRPGEPVQPPRIEIPKEPAKAESIKPAVPDETAVRQFKQKFGDELAGTPLEQASVQEIARLASQLADEIARESAGSLTDAVRSLSVSEDPDIRELAEEFRQTKAHMQKRVDALMEQEKDLTSPLQMGLLFLLGAAIGAPRAIEVWLGRQRSVAQERSELQKAIADLTSSYQQNIARLKQERERQASRERLAEFRARTAVSTKLLGDLTRDIVGGGSRDDADKALVHIARLINSLNQVITAPGAEWETNLELRLTRAAMLEDMKKLVGYYKEVFDRVYAGDIAGPKTGGEAGGTAGPGNETPAPSQPGPRR